MPNDLIPKITPNVGHKRLYPTLPDSAPEVPPTFNLVLSVVQVARVLPGSQILVSRIDAPQEWQINSKCGDGIYRGSCATGNRHGGHREQELPSVESRCRFG